MGHELLALWIVIIGLAMILGGSKAAKKMFQAPVRFATDLVLDFTAAVLRFGFDLISRMLRALGHQINRGARRLLGLPPPSRRRRRRPRRQREDAEYDDVTA